MTTSERVSVVLLTSNCAQRIGPVLNELTALAVPLLAVDNGSAGDSGEPGEA